MLQRRRLVPSPFVPGYFKIFAKEHVIKGVFCTKVLLRPDPKMSFQVIGHPLVGSRWCIWERKPSPGPTTQNATAASLRMIITTYPAPTSGESRIGSASVGLARRSKVDLPRSPCSDPRLRWRLCGFVAPSVGAASCCAVAGRLHCTHAVRWRRRMRVWVVPGVVEVSH